MIKMLQFSETYCIYFLYNKIISFVRKELWKKNINTFSYTQSHIKHEAKWISYELYVCIIIVSIFLHNVGKTEH